MPIPDAVLIDSVPLMEYALLNAGMDDADVRLPCSRLSSSTGKADLLRVMLMLSCFENNGESSRHS